MTLVFLFGINNIASSQETSFLSLIADSIEYDSATQRLVASGNVVITFEDVKLEATKIIYDAAQGRVYAEGSIRITGLDGMVFISDMAELSTDLKDGIIRGARLLLENQFQISVAEIRRTEGRFNTLYRAVGSSCQVCFDRPTPLWQIRSTRVVHDTETLRFYFENATFEVLGFPIMYLPVLRMVDPSVPRATGLLFPEFSSSEIYGYAAKLPFYITLGDHADATLTPFITSKGAILLEGQFRRVFQNGQLQLDGAFALRDGNGGSGTGFIALDAEFYLSRNRTLVADIKLTNNDGFLQLFGFDKSDRLVSTIGMNRYRADGFFEIGAVFFQSLRDDEVDAEVPFALPEISYRQTWEDPLLGGRIGVEVDSVGLIRASGRDVFRLSGTVDWRRDWNAPFGIRASTFAALNVDSYKVWQDPNYSDEFIFRMIPVLAAEMRLPLVRYGNDSILHVLEPVVQMVYASDLGFSGSIPNEDSLQVEFDETNLFAINRFPGKDDFETGARANVGISYRRYEPSGWTLGVDVGQVFRLEQTNQFSDGSGLSGTQSDTLAAVFFELPPRIRIINRLLMGPSFDVRRAESEIVLNYDTFHIDTSYIYLAPDVTAGSLDTRSEINLAASYRFQPNWEARFDWRRDLIENEDIFAGFGVTYGNECVEIDLYLSRRFTISNNVPSETSLDLSVRLAGFGGGLQNEWPAQRCLQMQ